MGTHDVPKTGIGKLRRNLLREKYEAAAVAWPAQRRTA